ncbi:hypothetical protein [Phyllobacterium salinisoli]|uniref:hypothetical protein n=1 Tax=Phyllobacterium salinisoli TaxID=1899321 RepID=UPI0011C04E56|nr:hypothetical protein [Phyllobacterium salinisoli]
MAWSGETVGKVTVLNGLTDGTGNAYITIHETNGTTRNWQFADATFGLGQSFALDILWDSLLNGTEITIDGYQYGNVPDSFWISSVKKSNS